MKKQIYTKEEYLDLINRLIKNSIKLGNKTQEAFIRASTDFYTEVIALDIEGIFQEKLYSYLGFNRLVCGNEACNNLTKFIDLKYGYREFCGPKCATTSKKVQDKIKETCLNKYGGSNPMCSNIVKEKIKNTMLERYGVVNASQSQEIKEKKINTSLKNSGTKYYAQTKEFLKKSSETFFKNHGVYSGFELIAKNNRIKGFEKLRVEGLDYNLELISVQVDTITYKCKTTDTIFSINRNTYKLRKKQQKTINLIELPLNNKISSLEKEIFEYVSSLNSTFTQSDTNILEGKEVDIISYDLNLGIEFNGLYWHCNLFKESDYHLNKTIQCNNNGIDLLHIFEDEWLYKKDIIKNIINKRLNLNVQLDANACIIDTVSIDELKTFLDINYLYRYDLSYDVESLGLYYDDILVALVVIDNNNVTYVELLGIEIESGFDLLFNTYIELNNVNYLTARTNRGKFYDLTYLNSGFVFDHYIEPQPFYIYQNIRLNKLYKDYTNTIHDCGQIEYIWNRN